MRGINSRNVLWGFPKQLIKHHVPFGTSHTSVSHHEARIWHLRPWAPTHLANAIYHLPVNAHGAVLVIASRILLFLWLRRMKAILLMMRQSIKHKIDHRPDARLARCPPSASRFHRQIAQLVRLARMYIESSMSRPNAVRYHVGMYAQ